MVLLYVFPFDYLCVKMTYAGIRYTIWFTFFKVYDDEIEKSYGGGESLRGYYSAAYSR